MNGKNMYILAAKKLAAENYDALCHLEEKFSERLRPLEVVQHREITAELQNIGIFLKYPSNRYYQLIKRWKRKLLKDRNLLLISVYSVPGTGYRFANSNGRVFWGVGQLTQANRKIKKAAKVAVKTDLEELTPENYHKCLALRALKRLSLKRTNAPMLENHARTA